ncbi:MAG: Ribosomal silencing factor RsfS [Chlamydiia bacterium]|nr:Ribosomal silencing factor RsfS [Chlamydiia bacterium]
MDKNARLKYIVDFLEDKKGVNPLVLDVSKFSNVTDYLVIIDGFVSRHVSAMGVSLAREMKDKFKERPLRVEGLQAGEWVLVDYGDIIVHIFMPGVRDRYNLETLWKEGQVVSFA